MPYLREIFIYREDILIVFLLIVTRCSLNKITIFIKTEPQFTIQIKISQELLAIISLINNFDDMFFP